MIKLLHLADLHIGVENYGRIDPATGLHTRLQDYLNRLDEAIDLGLQEAVDLVLIAGDVYKNRAPNPTHQREFARRIHKLRANNVPVVILTGNHDVSPALGKAHAVAIFDALAIDGVVIADRPRLHQIATRAGMLQLIAVPWVTRHNLMAREELRGASFTEIEYEVRRRLDRFISEKAAALDPAAPAVLAFHGSVDGATLGSERSITLGTDLALPRSSLTQPGIDYVALGHIHRHQALGGAPPIVYPGSIERVDFGERNEPKGCVIVELERGAANWRFHELQARPFISIEHDLRRSSDPLATVTNLIGRHDLRRAVVRLELQATHEQAQTLREEELRRLLEEAEPFVIGSIAIQVDRTSRRRFAGAEQDPTSLTPRRALEHYLHARAVDETRIAALLAAADELIGDGS
jgi:exonuclease SbcD